MNTNELKPQDKEITTVIYMWCIVVNVFNIVLNILLLCFAKPASVFMCVMIIFASAALIALFAKGLRSLSQQ